MKVIAIIERAVQSSCEELADGGLTAARDAHEDDEHGVIVIPVRGQENQTTDEPRWTQILFMGVREQDIQDVEQDGQDGKKVGIRS